MICPNCKRNIPDDSKLCCYCGQHIEESSGMMLCSNPQCGKEIPSDSMFCPFCGTEVSSTSAENSVQDKLTFEVNGVSFNMIRVEYGTFMMGVDYFDSYDYESWPVHKVELTDDYYIGETLITQELWVEVMEESSDDYEHDYGVGWRTHPINYISWDECQEFILNLNRITGKKFRLPTEAEWEFAARGGNKSKNYRYAGSNEWREVAWFDDNSDDDTHPVALLKPNELGIYDMNGDSKERCSDWYRGYSEEPQINPRGPKYGRKHVARGGSYINSPDYCNVFSRFKLRDDQNSGIRSIVS